MREIYKSGVTPQQKLVAVNNKFGNSGIQSQQGTSRIIYDTLPTGTATTFRFFEDSASRRFPFTNTGSDGNKLGVGDTMVIESVEFLLIDVNNLTNEIVAISSLVNYTFGPSNTLYLPSIFDFEIANNKVIKKLTLTEGSSAYSKNTSTQGTDIELETQIVLPPLLPYILELRTPIAISAAFIPGATRYIQAQIIGTGGIIAPRTTF
jgi:hypothetical protein